MNRHGHREVLAISEVEAGAGSRERSRAAWPPAALRGVAMWPLTSITVGIERVGTALPLYGVTARPERSPGRPQGAGRLRPA